MKNETDTAAPIASRAHVVMLSWLKPGAASAMAEFRAEAAPLFRKYGLRVDRALSATGKGQLVGTNAHAVPDLIQVLSFPSVQAFREYSTDPDYLRLAKLRDAHVARMTALVGAPREVPLLDGPSPSEPTARLYAVAFVRFRPGGAEGMDEFNRGARDLFQRHGMHIEMAMDVQNVVAPVGEPLLGFAPQRALVFYLDEPQALTRYVADPQYSELAPLRDRGLEAYDFFLAKVSP